MSGSLQQGQAKLALVVDDSVMQCQVLSILLQEEGYQVVTANDGASGVEAFLLYQPDLVLMDINMPVMNGYEATRQIKLASKNQLCPLIFITSMDSDQAFVESIESGGDGILVRPFSPSVFKAKIKSIQRISDLYSEVKRLQQEQQKDAELAEQLMSRVIEARNFALDRISIVKKPATLFSGDIQLTALCPNGDVNILLGDFTGHGLRSSIGAIPLAETFRVMTGKGFNLIEIITQINRQLYHLLPPDLFLGAAVVSVSSNEGSAYIYNAGLPDVYVFSSQAKISHKISSLHPPMGVLPTLLAESKVQIIPVHQDDHIVLISDGIVEARNNQGEMFEVNRFEQAAKAGVLTATIGESVLEALDNFCAGHPQEDDISLIAIPCNALHQQATHVIATHTETKPVTSPLDDKPLWSWQLTLSGDRLARVNPIPIIMNQIQEIEGGGEHWQNLYTILTELFVNALDHGVLGLSSNLKTDAEGFAAYYRARERLLSTLTDGFVRITMHYYQSSGGGRVLIWLKDSGQGFDVNQVKTKQLLSSQQQDSVLMGRGILLLEQLCESLDYKEKGTLVHAVYHCG